MDDLYIELMRHNQEDENRVNPVLINLAKKHDVKVIATNNTYYWKQQDANAHDILLCVKDGEKQATPKGKGRGYRYGLPNEEYYFKSTNEMKSLFADLPEAIINTQEIVDKIEAYYAQESYGSWRNNILLVSDDVDEPFERILQQTTDDVATDVKAQKPFLNSIKVHSDSFQQLSSSGGDLVFAWIKSKEILP